VLFNKNGCQVVPLHKLDTGMVEISPLFYRLKKNVTFYYGLLNCSDFPPDVPSFVRTSFDERYVVCHDARIELSSNVDLSFDAETSENVQASFSPL
jgi:hypothetical protein